VKISLRARSFVGVILVAAAVAGCSRSAADFVERGDGQLAKGNVDAAVLEYRRAVEADPMLAPARLKLAEAFVRQGNGPGALAESVRAADLLPRDAEAQMRAGSMLLAAGRARDALSRADKAIALDAKRPEALVLRANALAALPDLDAAVEQIQQAIALKPDPAWQANLGILQHARGRLDEAEAAFRQGVATGPKSLAVRLALAKFLSGTGRAGEAEGEFQAALSMDPGDAAANQALAAFYVASNRAPEAEPLLRKVAERSGATSAWFDLADYYAANGRGADALAVLEKLGAAPRTWALAKSKAATLLASDGKAGEALRVIDGVIARQPAYSQARVIRARILQAQGQEEEALAEVRQAVKADPRAADAHFLLGSILKRRRDLEGAAAAFNETLRLSPRFVRVQVQLAEVEMQRGNTAAATQLAEQAARLEPGNPEARLIFARGLLARGDLDRAAAATKELTAAFPQVGAVHAQAGLVALRTGDREGARSSFERALALDALLVEPLAGLAALDQAQGRPERARGRIAERLERTPRSSAVLVLAARTWAATGDPAKTEEFLRRAIEADPTSLEAYELLGGLYVSQKRLDEALAEYDRLAARQPGAIGPPTMAGLILQAQGRQDEARQRYERLVEASPRAAVAANNLAWMYANRGEQLDRALSLAQAATAELPDHPGVNDTLGFVYLKKGMPALAIPPLRLAAGKEPAEPLYHFHLGLAYSQAGNKAEARRALERALQLKGDFAGSEEARKVLGTLE